jgi:hypothetical protein
LSEDIVIDDDLDVTQDDSNLDKPLPKFSVEQSVIKRKIEDMLEARRFKAEFDDFDF